MPASALLIPWSDFATLRLASFLPASEIRDIKNWEYMERIWCGEAAGFTEWLRLANDPNVLRSMALDLRGLPRAVARTVCNRIRLPLAKDMSPASVDALLGASRRSYRWNPTRVTFEYQVGGSESYDVSCTFENDALTYVTIMRTDYMRTPQE